MPSVKLSVLLQMCRNNHRYLESILCPPLVANYLCSVCFAGLESDAAEIISSTGEGSAAIQSLSRQVAFLKREYEKVKLEKRQLKDHLDKLQLNELSKSKKIQCLTKECQISKEQLERSEGDLKITEKHLEILKQKNARLVSKLKKVSNSSVLKEAKGLNSSSFSDLLNESTKMQMFSASTPKLTAPSSPRQNTDLETSFDLFSSPSPVKDKSASEDDELSQRPQASTSSQMFSGSNKRPLETENSENDSEVASQVFKITSASESNSQKLKRFKSDSAMRETNPILKYANMNIFKKKELGERFKNKGSVVQKGFDGLGGHTTHINSMGNPFKVPKRTQTKAKKNPSLPKLDNFITID